MDGKSLKWFNEICIQIDLFNFSTFEFSICIFEFLISDNFITRQNAFGHRDHEVLKC